MMKKFREFRDKLTLKQATAISLILPALVCLILACIFVKPYFAIEGVSSPSICIVLMMSMVTYGALALFAIWILDVNGKELQRDWHAAKAYVIPSYKLSKDNYVELKYLFDKALENASDDEHLTILLTNANYTFFAKLTENEEINLLTKDVDGNVISDEIIGNFSYLKAYFEPLN